MPPSVSTRTPPQLRVLGGEGDAPEALRLEPTARLQRFLDAAAERGLDADAAIRLGLERALCLRDAARFAADVEAGRMTLNRAAGRARAQREMTPGQAVYLRTLAARRPVPARDVGDGLAAAVPERVLSRVDGSLSQGGLHSGVVEEMISWEIAATLSARTMNEWALLQLLRRRSTSAGA